VIGRAGIGCEPASAATLAGICKLVRKGVIRRNANEVGVLTGNLLKDPDYIFRYHTNTLKTPSGELLQSNFANQPKIVSSNPDELIELLKAL
jgi:threonine synthase